MYILFVTFICGYFNVIGHKSTHASIQTHLEKRGITVGKQTRGMCEVTKERYIQLI